MSEYYRPVRWALETLGGRIGGQILGWLKTRDPVHDLDAATKGYVDDALAAGGGSGSAMDYVYKPYAYKNGVGSIHWGWHSYLGCGPIGGSHQMDRGYTYIMPLWVGDQALTWDEIGIRLVSSGAGSSVRLGLYELDHTNDLLPSRLIADYGTVPTTSVSPREKTLAINLTTISVYWLGIGMQAEGSVTPPRLNAVTYTLNGGALYGYAIPYYSTSEAAFGLKAQTQVSDGALQTDLDDFAVFDNATFPGGYLRRAEA